MLLALKGSPQVLTWQPPISQFSASTASFHPLTPPQQIPLGPKIQLPPGHSDWSGWNSSQLSRPRPSAGPDVGSCISILPCVAMPASVTEFPSCPQRPALLGTPVTGAGFPGSGLDDGRPWPAAWWKLKFCFVPDVGWTVSPRTCQSLDFASVDVTLLGNKVFTGVTEMRSRWRSVGPNPAGLVSLLEEARDGGGGMARGRDTQRGAHVTPKAETGWWCPHATVPAAPELEEAARSSLGAFPGSTGNPGDSGSALTRQGSLSGWAPCAQLRLGPHSTSHRPVSCGCCAESPGPQCTPLTLIPLGGMMGGTRCVTGPSERQLLWGSGSSLGYMSLTHPSSGTVTCLNKKTDLGRVLSCASWMWPWVHLDPDFPLASI